MEKNLQNEQALEKFKSLVKDVNICMFITNTRDDANTHTRPMATVDVEDDGTLWFYTDIRSIKVEEVESQRDVHLVYAHPGKDSYLDIWGTASVVTDKQQIKDKWSPMVKVYFSQGTDDPNLALLKVKPEDCYYWDNETGKMVYFLKAAASIVTGKRLAKGAEGSLDV
ncbi:MAG TPA: pyridoxamine 5'-phosphate oxidase family protein [Flavisolibacter sp.]|jgi:general stress protein 26|nr:pyridoxamine 5'-phosphate oxidase family protein [Flavisolibacter sp.]